MSVTKFPATAGRAPTSRHTNHHAPRPEIDTPPVYLSLGIGATCGPRYPTGVCTRYALPRPDLPAFPRLNIGSILGGRGRDYVLVEPPYVPDLCTIIVDVHFVSGMTVDEIVADIRRALDPLVAGDPELRYEIEIPPPASFKGRRRLVMDPFDIPIDTPIVQAVARSYRAVTGQEPKAIGTVLPHSYSADDTCHLWKAGIPCLLYGPATIRGTTDEDDACVLASEMVKVTQVLAVTALDVCRQPRGVES